MPPILTNLPIKLNLTRPKEIDADDDDYDDEYDASDKDDDEGATNWVEHDEAEGYAKGGVEHREETTPDRLRGWVTVTWIWNFVFVIRISY